MFGRKRLQVNSSATTMGGVCRPCMMVLEGAGDTAMLKELDQYQEYLARLPISDHTRRNYLGRVRQYLLWLAGSPDAEQALA